MVLNDSHAVTYQSRNHSVGTSLTAVEPVLADERAPGPPLPRSRPRRHVVKAAAPRPLSPGRWRPPLKHYSLGGDKVLVYPSTAPPSIFRSINHIGMTGSAFMTQLRVRNFAQIEDAQIQFGDLTVLVGPQATGKSLLLQWLKLAIDAGEVFHALKDAGHDVRKPENIIDLVFGEGMGGAFKEGTQITLDERAINVRDLFKGARRVTEGNLFFIPAHRALLLAEGWPAPFLKLNADTPVVARLFSQNLYLRFSGRSRSALFPVTRILKEQYRKLIDDAVFHGGRVELDQEGLRYRLRLSFEDVHLPFMTWTAGQREFTPLLLGLYHVLPPRKRKKHPRIDWVVVEEPEMGLHPQAISVFMLLVLDLLWRGYKVVLSTHSPLVLDVVWAIQRISSESQDWRLLRSAFGASASQTVVQVLKNALTREYRVYSMILDPKTRKVTTADISRLDPESPNSSEADWGGLTGFSSRFGAAVRESANAAV